MIFYFNYGKEKTEQLVLLISAEPKAWTIENPWSFERSSKKTSKCDVAGLCSFIRLEMAKD